MAKKQNKVVIDEAYLEILREKSEFLDSIFGEEERAVIAPDDFKHYQKLEKALNKINTGDEPYEPSK